MNYKLVSMKIYGKQLNFVFCIVVELVPINDILFGLKHHSKDFSPIKKIFSGLEHHNLISKC